MRYFVLKKSVFIPMVACLIVGSFFLIHTSLASAYEWISSFWSPANCCHSEVTYTPSWQASTADNYDEYRSLYFATSTSDSAVPTEWTEFQTCRKQSYINGTGPVDSCNITIPTGGTNSSSTYFWMRATTNYSGCGSWTPNPSENCGDAISTAAPFLPRYSCKDSDNGYNWWISGTATSTDWVTQTDTTLSDTCESASVAKEIVCSANGQLETHTSNCNCVNGACQ